MIKITHYEVYTDNGSGWQLEDRFSSEQRQDAFNLAKEREIEKLKVKIIKEIFDVQDNSYQETVEYVSNLSKNAPPRPSSGADYPELHPQNTAAEHVASQPAGGAEPLNSVWGAVLKLIVLIVVCLALSNFLVTLLFPVFESLVPEENSKSVLFLLFFGLFIGMAVPLSLKIIPWYVFTYRRVSIERPAQEKKFFNRAARLIQLYNLNDDVDPIVTPVYPEAPLEYKQYLVSFLTELLSNLESNTSLKNRFSRLGIKLMIYGGCLEMARVSGLKLPQANTMLYEAFKITDGKEADLEAFYEAKRSFRDNKIAIFLTGVGAYMMSNVMSGLPLPTDLLNVAFNKWERQNRSEHYEEQSEAETVQSDDILKTVMVSIKSDLKFLDTAIPNQEEVATNTSANIRNIIFNLLSKYHGDNTVEENGITTIRFAKLNYGIKFAIECLKDIATYQDETSNENLILRNCCAVTAWNSEDEPNLSSFLADIFDHIYNNEIVVTKEVRETLADTDYKFDFLGEKLLNRQKQNIELYKLLD